MDYIKEKSNLCKWWKTNHGLIRFDSVEVFYEFEMYGRLAQMMSGASASSTTIGATETSYAIHGISIPAANKNGGNRVQDP